MMAKAKRKPAGKKKTAARAGRKQRAPRKPRAKPRATPKAKKPAPSTVAEEHAPKTPKLRLPAAQRKHFQGLLVQMRDRLLDGINFLATNNLRNSQREASGDISNYSTHMADAGTDNFDREFALSLVSNEQDFLYEVDEALKRLDNNTYGICASCAKPINRQRLEVLPFASLCVRCQENVEKQNRRPARAVATFPQFEEAEEGETEGEEEKEKA